MMFPAFRHRIVSWKAGQLATTWVAGLGLITAAIVYYLDTPAENRRIADSVERQTAWWNDWESIARSRADTAKWQLRLIAEWEGRGGPPAKFALQKQIAEMAIRRVATTSDNAIRANYALQMARLTAQNKRTARGDLALAVAGGTFVILLALSWVWFGRGRRCQRVPGSVTNLTRVDG